MVGAGTVWTIDCRRRPPSACVDPGRRPRIAPRLSAMCTGFEVPGITAVTRSSPSMTPLDANKTYSVATSDFMARGGDDYVAFRDAKPVLPPADSPTVAYEVIDYIKSIGTIRTGVDGRIVLK